MQKFITFLSDFNAGDLILLLTFLAIIWYSIETHFLRKWQKKQVQLSLLAMHLQRQIATQEHHGKSFFPFGEDYVKAVRGIMELGKFDAKTLFSPAFHYPITKRRKLTVLIHKVWNNIKKLNTKI